MEVKKFSKDTVEPQNMGKKKWEGKKKKSEQANVTKIQLLVLGQVGAKKASF